MIDVLVVSDKVLLQIPQVPHFLLAVLLKLIFFVACFFCHVKVFLDFLFEERLFIFLYEIKKALLNMLCISSFSVNIL